VVLSKAATKCLMEEALPANPRVTVSAEGKLSYRPPHRLRNTQALEALLRRNQLEGRGGLALSELRDSIPLPEVNIRKVPNVIDIPTGVGWRSRWAVAWGQR
jgi:hypothetical protein